MSNAIESQHGFNEFLKLSERLYVSVSVDYEDYIDSGTTPTVDWEGVAKRLSKKCQEAIKTIYLVTGALPSAGQRVANDSDYCMIQSVDFRVFGGDVLITFVCEQMPHRQLHR